MKTRLIIDNKFVCVENADRSVIRKIEKITSYLVAGHYYAPSFRAHRWDGKEHLLKYSKRYGYRFPTGLLMNVLDMLKKNDLEFETVDARRRKSASIKYFWDKNVVLRPYQKKCVKAVVSKPMPGRGIVVMPIRSGKTIVAAAIAKKLGVQFAFCVTSQLLLRQTQRSFEKIFHEEIGIIGDGEWNEQRITVATVQTLSRAKGGEKTGKDGGKKTTPTDPRYKPFMEKVDLVFFDECHHLKAGGWRSVFQDFDTPYKIGLSATVFLDNERECEKGVIWLQACCGNVRYRISPTKLIREGFLMAPEIKLYRVDEPKGIVDYRWSNSLAVEAIYKNEKRNELICELANEHLQAGRKVLIIANRLAQIDALSETLHDAGVLHAVVTGRTSSAKRKELIEDYVEGHYNVLMGTVFGEGVDLPSVEVVINAEGGRDIKSTIQKMRNLTPKEGKTKAIYVDFMDFMNPYFAEHSLERLRVYREEAGFKIKIQRA